MIETLEQPKPQKLYEWRCWYARCEALMRACALDAKYVERDGEQLVFECPHCRFYTTVPA